MMSRTRLLIGAVCATIAAFLDWMLVLLGRNNVFQIIVALLFTLSAGVSWMQYTKKQQEEENHD